MKRWQGKIRCLDLKSVRARSMLPFENEDRFEGDGKVGCIALWNRRDKNDQSFTTVE